MILTQLTIPLKYVLCPIARQLYTTWAIESLKYFKSHSDNKLPNLEIFYYIHWLGEGIDVQK